jgi:ribonuclease VapC
MVIDTSALVALFLLEPGHAEIADLIDEAESACLSVVSRLELVSVLCGRRVQADPAQVGEFIDGLNLDHVPVSLDQMHLAIRALLAYGKGRHPARLNFGDCFSYALAKERDETLLFKGDDFARTDILPAWQARP